MTLKLSPYYSSLLKSPTFLEKTASAVFFITTNSLGLLKVVLGSKKFARMLFNR